MAATSCAIAMERGGFLTALGNETVDFLNRLSTNDLSSLKMGSCRYSVLTSEKGKIIDLINVVSLPENILLMTSPDRSAIVQSWLERYVIMEDIRFMDVSNEQAMISLIGPNSLNSLSSLLEISLSNESSAIQFHEFATGRAVIFCDDRWALPKYIVTANEPTISMLRDRAVQLGLLQLSPFILEQLRIEQGVQAAGKDYDGEVNPLEASFDKYISSTKGCYIGQEVLARLDTYKKLKIKLRGFILENRLMKTPLGEITTPDGMPVGKITSCTWSYRFQRPIALGYLKTSAQEHSLTIGTSTEKIDLTVTPLPFHSYTELAS